MEKRRNKGNTKGDFNFEKRKRKESSILPVEIADHLTLWQLLNVHASFQGHPIPLGADDPCTQ